VTPTEAERGGGDLPSAIVARPDHGYDRSLESGANPFARRFGELGDEAWLGVLQRSISESTIDGVEFPGFPGEELQRLIHGSAGADGIVEAWQFYRYCRDCTFGADRGTDGLRLLDFGAGWGRISRLFMREFDSAHLFAYEPNQLFCTIARTLNPYVSFLRGGMLPSRSLPRDWFDVVVGYSVFSHLPESSASAWLAEIANSLRPGGWCVMTSWGRRFLDRLMEDDERQRRGDEISWHTKLCLEVAGDLDARVAEFERGEFVFLGDERALYGEAILPEAALRRLLTDDLDLELVRFDIDLLAQDAFVLRKATGVRRSLEAAADTQEDAAPQGGHPVFLSNDGYCPVCESETRFSSPYYWLRDHYRCERCKCIPRERALLTVLNRRFPNWRALAIHESSPGFSSSRLLARDCPRYTATHYFPDQALGGEHAGFRNEDLSRQTFPDGTFDLVITQDVMEHVLDPEGAFREIARTLKPGGAHVFTTPIYPDLAVTEIRARLRDGQVDHLAEPEYHGNPIDPEGSLVTVRWGQDIGEIVARSSGLMTTIYLTVDRQLGLDGEFLEVLVSRKPA
jgi:SAM-dependent methyltransferase